MCVCVCERERERERAVSCFTLASVFVTVTLYQCLSRIRLSDASKIDGSIDGLASLINTEWVLLSACPQYYIYYSNIINTHRDRVKLNGRTALRSSTPFWNARATSPVGKFSPLGPIIGCHSNVPERSANIMSGDSNAPKILTNAKNLVKIRPVHSQITGLKRTVKNKEKTQQQYII